MIGGALVLGLLGYSPYVNLALPTIVRKLMGGGGGGALVLGPLYYSPYVNLALPTIVRKLNLIIYATAYENIKDSSHTTEGLVLGPLGYRGSSRGAPGLQPICKSGLAFNSQEVKGGGL